jgi:hypothetical protein
MSWLKKPVHLTTAIAFIVALTFFTSEVGAQSPTPLLPPPGFTQSAAIAINNDGEVAGTSNGAVVWDRDGMPAPLLPLDGDVGSTAFGINTRGVVVGMSSGAGGDTAVVWHKQ